MVSSQEINKKRTNKEMREEIIRVGKDIFYIIGIGSNIKSRKRRT